MTRAANDNEASSGYSASKRTSVTQKTADRFRALDDLPLFASESQIAAAVLGPGKAVEWRGIVKLLEGRGFPHIDGLHGGRYVPAVRAFYDVEYGVRPAWDRPAKEPHRPADLNAQWKKRSAKSAA